MVRIRRWNIFRSCGAILGAAAWLAFAPGGARFAVAQQPPSESIQKQREAMEREKLDYMDEKGRVEHINERVRRYKQLMASVPFELAPNTVDMVQVFVNGHDIHKIAWDLYSISDESSEQGFAQSYWPTVLYLNRAKDYDTGMPSYGKFDPSTPELNVALFPNVRKQGYRAVIAEISNQDSSAALAATAPVVLAYRKRLQEQVASMVGRGGEVQEITGPANVPAENHLPLFLGLQQDPAEQYPARRAEAGAALISTDPVVVDRPAPLDPSPPAWSLRQGVNMLGPNYQGYNVQYTPDKFDLAPEFAPIAFMGGRDPSGTPRTQPGLHFGLNQRFFNFLLVNESAFVAFSSGGAPSMNGGSLNGGVDFTLFKLFDVVAAAGASAVNVDSSFEFGPSFTGKLRTQVSSHVWVFGLGMYTPIDHLRIEYKDSSGKIIGGKTGVINASYFGLGVLLR
jgi:hypothetical protein